MFFKLFIWLLSYSTSVGIENEGDSGCELSDTFFSIICGTYGNLLWFSFEPYNLTSNRDFLSVREAKCSTSTIIGRAIPDILEVELPYDKLRNSCEVSRELLLSSCLISLSID